VDDYELLGIEARFDQMLAKLTDGRYKKMETWEIWEELVATQDLDLEKEANGVSLLLAVALKRLMAYQEEDS